MSTLYSVGQMNQLADALELAGFTPQDLSELRNYPHWADIKAVLCGQAEINYIQHLIDGDADAFVPSYLSGVEYHKKLGQFKAELRTDGLYLNNRKIDLYLSKKQQKGKVIDGNELYKELSCKPVLNANILDFLLKNPQLIPESWKQDENGTRYIYFWGTIYRDPAGFLSVRDLYWDGGRWQSHCHWLDFDWHDQSPAAVLAS